MTDITVYNCRPARSMWLHSLWLEAEAVTRVPPELRVDPITTPLTPLSTGLLCGYFLKLPFLHFRRCDSLMLLPLCLTVLKSELHSLCRFPTIVAQHHIFGGADPGVGE